MLDFIIDICIFMVGLVASLTIAKMIIIMIVFIVVGLIIAIRDTFKSLY